MRRRNQTEIAIALGIMLATAGQGALAGPLGERLSASGQIGFAMAPDTGHLALTADADAAFALGAGFALNLGFYGAATDLTGEIDTPHETYGTLFWQGNRLSFAIGVPRPAYDSVALSALERLDPGSAIGAEFVGATRSRATWGAIHNGDLPLGLRVDGIENGYTWAVSAHRMDDLDLVSAGINWSPVDDASLRLGLAVEWASDGNHGAKASLDREFGRFDLGAAVFFAPVAGLADIAEARVNFEAQPGLDLSLVYQAQRDADAALVLGAQKAIGSNGYLKGAVRAQDDIASVISFGVTFGD